MAFTPGPWAWGDWTILDEDREAQRDGNPFWTFVARKDGDRLSRIPDGKVRELSEIVWGTGWEVEGIDASDDDRALIAAAPALYEALTKIVAMEEGRDDDWMEEATAALAKARGES